MSEKRLNNLAALNIETELTEPVNYDSVLLTNLQGLASYNDFF